MHDDNIDARMISVRAGKTIDRYGFSAEELDDVSLLRLPLKMWLISKLSVIYVYDCRLYPAHIMLFCRRSYIQP